MNACVVAIAKNEGRFIHEWLAHHLAVGFDRMVVYDHESTDETSALLDAAAQIAPVTRIPWSPPSNQSPQISAYNDALRRLHGQYDWLAFLDLDEFLVIRKPDLDLKSFLDSVDADVGAVGVNWLTFGSGGRLDTDYELVRDTFRTGGPRHWGNNRHIKTIARAGAIERMGIHDAQLAGGRYVLPDGSPLTMSKKRGIADRIDHSVLQLHHYQVKSHADFQQKLERGRAGKRLDDPTRIRNNGEDFLSRLDRNSHRFDDIDWNRDSFLAAYLRLRPGRSLPPSPPGRSMTSS